MRTINESTAGVLGDAASASLDEIPVAQDIVNDSRAHICGVQAAVSGGTGALEAASDKIVLSFRRNDLVLDPDEALFVNTNDISGALDVTFSTNLWYDT